jgi:hypothetical protein
MSKRTKQDESLGIISNRERGFRKAAGNKFELKLDSYMFAIAKDGNADNQAQGPEGEYVAILIDGDAILDKLIELALEQNARIGLTPEEVLRIRETDGVVVLEDTSGFVFVHYFTDREEAWMEYELFAPYATNTFSIEEMQEAEETENFAVELHAG